MATENASSHKSKLSKRYPESAGGDVPMYLPLYTPQLNPTQVQRRTIKARLAVRHSAAGDQIENSIMRLAESGVVQPVRISGLPIA